jgi:hypothetical protein
MEIPAIAVLGLSVLVIVGGIGLFARAASAVLKLLFGVVLAVVMLALLLVII